MKKEVSIIFLLLCSMTYASDIVGYIPGENIVLEETPYSVNLFLENNTITQEDYIKADVNIIYLNDSQKRQYNINYLIKKQNEIISKDTRTIVIEKEVNFKKEFFISKTIDPGKYEFSVEVRYLNYSQSASKEFYVSEKIEKYYYLNLILYTIILISIITILFIIISERKRLKNIEKNQPEQLKNIYDEFKKKRKREETLHKLKRELRLLNEARSLRVISKESYENAEIPIKKLIDKIKK